MATRFFSEMPYAAALDKEYLRKRCSNCFAVVRTIEECTSGCGKVIYCDKNCAENDRIWHQNECIGFKMCGFVPPATSIDAEVRLIGRLLARKKIDEGVADLSIDFPRHLAKDRQLDDLISHKGKLTKSVYSRKHYERVHVLFVEFFRDTPLAKTKRSEFVRTNCMIKINAFSVTTLESDDPRSLEDIGEALYLNASRFNHSCRPSLLFSFDGCRLIVKQFDENRGANAVAGGREKWEMSKQEFENLSFNYGYSAATALPLTPQRLRSLKNRYFFRCRCELCTDRKLSKLQSRASTIECSQCGQPFVWRVKLWGVSLKPVCECPQKNKFKTKGLEAEIRSLEKMWKAAVEKSAVNTKSDAGMALLRNCVQMAQKYWHPVQNLRYGHLNEKVQQAWYSRVTQFQEANEPFQHALDESLKASESMLRPYLRYAMPWDLTIAVIIQRMAERYMMMDGDEATTQRIAELCFASARIWEANGEDRCVEALVNAGNSFLQMNAIDDAPSDLEEAPPAVEGN